MKIFSKLRRAIPQVYTFSFLIFSVVVIGFFLFHPTIAGRWNPLYRKYLLNNFLTELQKTKTLDPQMYWEFRERYSPGHMEFNGGVVGIFQNYRIDQLDEQETIELMFYQSPLIKSTDGVVNQQDMIPAFKAAMEPNERIIVETPTFILIRNDNSNSYTLQFALPIEEMRKANGFFDYLPQEQKLLEGKQWINSTSIEVR